MNGLDARLRKLSGAFGADDLDSPEVAARVAARLRTLLADGGETDPDVPREGETLRQWYARRGCPV